MSVYTVHGLHVLGYQKTPTRPGTFHEVDIPFETSLSAHEHIMINVQGSDGKSNKHFLERERLRKAYLEQQYVWLGRAAFIKKWVEFRFDGDEAKGAACLIIDNYFRINKNGFLSQEEGTHYGVQAHYEKLGYFDAWGGSFFINLVFQSRKKLKWWNSKPQPNILSFHINLLNIKSIRGTLERFTVYTNTHRLYFSWHIIIEENLEEPAD